MKATIVFSLALLGLASAAPRPQDLPLSEYEAVPTAIPVAAPVGNDDQNISYDATAAQTSAVSSALDPAATSFKLKRQACAGANPEDPGNGPLVVPDTDNAFLASTVFSNAALTATTPPGYFLVDGFQNLKSSAQDTKYLGYISDDLTFYDTQTCANYCSNKEGCLSFNIYYERDPSVEPDYNTCLDPPSVTRIKCAFFGSPITLSGATNIGQYQSGFHVVIAGSNTYTTHPQSVAGFTGPTSLGNACINSPVVDGTYMGVQVFPATQAYDPSVCAAACNAKSAYNQRHATLSSPARICDFFDAYILYKNGQNGIFTCTYYTKSYGSLFATNTGQYNGAGDHFTIGNSYTYTLA